MTNYNQIIYLALTYNIGNNNKKGEHLVKNKDLIIAENQYIHLLQDQIISPMVIYP